MTVPIWITPGNLGTYIETYSFNINPLTVSFSAPTDSTVTRLNGNLPAGLQWQRQNNTIVITGESNGVAIDTVSQITWRITNPQNQVADRTFTISITPVVNAPSWFGQRSFLGYASSGVTTTYTVSATTDTAYPIVYSIPEFTPPVGLSINSQTGVITYIAPTVLSDVITPFTIRATTGAVYSDLDVTISVLTIPHAPAWITPSGLIAEDFENQFVEVPIAAYESSGAPISYSIVSSTPSFPFTLVSNASVSNQALIYGNLPIEYTTTVYQFTVAATSVNGVSIRTFDIIGNPSSIGDFLRWTNSSANLGPVLDGRFYAFDVSAITTQPGTIDYNLVGGILPRTLILDRQFGFISGFLEFQTRDRDYYFDISANDGVQTITRRYTLSVQRGVKYQYLNLTIPLEGNIKNAYYNYAGTVINYSWVPDANVTPQELQYTPYIPLITGLNYSVDNPSTAINFANLHLHTSEVMIGAVTNVEVSPTTTFFYSSVLDNTDGADSVIPQIADVLGVSNDTVTVSKGLVTFDSLTMLPASSSLVVGTQLRISNTNNPTVWMQGPITFVSDYVIIIDSQLTSGAGTNNNWQIKFAPTYPPSLENIRNDLISGLGWVTDGQGSGAELQAIIDYGTNTITGIEIINPGSGYLYEPTIVVSGGTIPATISSNLTVIGYTINYPGTNWTVGQEITISHTSNSPAIVKVSEVDENGSILNFEIITGGSYTVWPVGIMRLTNDTDINSLPADVTFKLGILDCRVIDGGAGYTSASVSVAGKELLPSWQKTWFPYIGIGTVYTSYGDDVVNRQTPEVNAEFYYNRWPLQHAIIEMQGINWTGDTTFDGGQTQWDGGGTFFAEWLEPKDTIFDNNLEIFDFGNTRFDDDYVLWQGIAYLAWGTTIFDQEFTIFDLYSTTFDQSIPTTQSITLLRRLLRITTPQISGHNVVV